MFLNTSLKYTFAALLIGTTAIHADIADDTYKSLIGKSIFTSNNQFLQTGWYEFDKENGDTPELSNANFVGSYYFGQKGDTWRPFIQGGFGFSQIEQDAVQLGSGVVGDIDLDSTYWKAGGGINFNPNSDIALVVGASAMWMNTDSGNFHAYTTPVSQKINTLFNSESDTTLYDVYGSVVFHPTLMSYNTHFEATMHYINIDYDHGISEVDGYNADLKAGFHTHELTTIMDLPLWAEFYLGAVLVNDDLSDVVGFDSALNLGASLHWKVGPMIHIFDDAFKDTDISANLQGTTSNTDYEGWKASLSFNIVKF
jgi:hypothetical protein